MESNCRDCDQDLKFRPVGLNYLSEKLHARAKSELNESEENIKLGLKIMKEKIQKEKLYMDKDEVLLRFLRAKKYKFLESFEGYKNYLKAIEICLKKLKFPDQETFLEHAMKNIISILPYRDSEDRAIYLYRLGIYHKVGLSVEDCICLLVAGGFVLVSDPASQIGGIALLVDAKEMIYSDGPVIMSYIRWLIPLLRGFPARVRRIDIINQSTLFGTIINIARSFMPSKIRNRIRIHGNNIDSLLQVYPSAVIPHEYGGTLGPMDNGHFRKSPLSDRLNSCYNYFLTYTQVLQKSSP